MKSDRFTIRHYEPSDYPLLKEWREGHGASEFPEELIPASTCIVEMDGEPVASGSVYPCNNNGVAFFHGLVIRPGIAMMESRMALFALQDGIDIIMRNGGHTLLLGTVEPGAMERGAKMMGFQSIGPLVQGVYRTINHSPENEHGS